jgi:hypothetical protein
MVDVWCVVIFEHVTLFPYHLYSLSIHYKASHIPNYIVIPMFLNNDQLYEVVKYFKAKMKVCFEVPFPFYPWLYACLLVDQVRAISKTMLMQMVFDVSLAIICIL